MSAVRFGGFAKPNCQDRPLLSTKRRKYGRTRFSTAATQRTQSPEDRRRHHSCPALHRQPRFFRPDRRGASREAGHRQQDKGTYPSGISQLPAGVLHRVDPEDIEENALLKPKEEQETEKKSAIRLRAADEEVQTGESEEGTEGSESEEEEEIPVYFYEDTPFSEQASGIKATKDMGTVYLVSKRCGALWPVILESESADYSGNGTA